MSQNSFTLVELLVVISILIILTFLVIPAFSLFQRESGLISSAEGIINILRLAQNKTLASEEADQWGVYFSTSSFPHQYTLFKGGDFISRDISFDEIYELSEAVEIYEINLWEKEVVFKKVSGYASTTDQFGNVSLRVKTDPAKTRSIYINNTGQIGLVSPIIPSDADRIKDSRHIHLFYSGREIATSTEKIILTFAGTVIKEVNIADNLKEGQIDWSGTVEVEGENQKIYIHTHQLNNNNIPSSCSNLPCTIFSIHRDQRYNNKTLDIDISGDAASSPILINYTADGLTNQGNSSYVSQPIWQ